MKTNESGTLWSETPVLRVDGLSRRFGAGCSECIVSDSAAGRSSLEKNWCPKCGAVHAVSDVSFSVFPGEVLGIVGESGSGKSTVMNALYFDDEPTAGSAYLTEWKEGEADIFAESSQSRRRIRNELMGKVYQNPLLGLKMKFSAMANIAEKLIAAGSRDVGKMEQRATDLLNHVNIPEFRMKDAPKYFSGGMQQRVQIAKALSNNPPILLLDEVTTGLDVSVQARVLDLIKAIQRELGVSMLLVSHDLGIIRMLADRTLVMLNGRVIEDGLTDQILEDPQEPYTQELVQSLL
ncbi:MAG: ATP-binding cassette domain-containing protein [Spirochaetaceae bacterium]|nr:ATP-binding cassette domain-containing protein [Spirochaetaceae bacterium]MDT8296909.1 ATP-binding cassette domain-containing protein [Spirochaetaceae bacterium]